MNTLSSREIIKRLKLIKEIIDCSSENYDKQTNKQTRKQTNTATVSTYAVNVATPVLPGLKYLNNSNSMSQKNVVEIFLNFETPQCQEFPSVHS